jgi:hypothetical protein
MSKDKITKERIERIKKKSEQVSVAMLAPLQDTPDISLQEGLTILAVGLMNVLDTLSQVIGEDPKETLETFIGALQEDAKRR